MVQELYDRIQGFLLVGSFNAYFDLITVRHGKCHYAHNALGIHVFVPEHKIDPGIEGTRILYKQSCISFDLSGNIYS